VGNLLITAKQKNLLINSTVCDDNINLKNILRKYKNGLSIEDIEKTKDEMGDVYYILRSKEIVKTMIENSEKEWIQEKPIGIVEKPCDLCNSTLSKEKFVIRNKLNENKLLIGSSCIEKFTGIKREIIGERPSEIIKLNGDKEWVYDRLASFNRMYQGGKEIIDKWKIFYDDFDIVFPIEIEKDFESYYRKARKFYKDYKNGKIPEDDLKNFKFCIVDFEHLKKKIVEFKEKNKGNKFLCTKEIAEELKKSDLNKILTIIKENGAIISKWQVKYIENTNFIKQFYIEIREYLKENNVNLLEIENKKVIGEIIRGDFSKIKIEMNTKVFMRMFYWIISKEQLENNNEDFIKSSNILKTKSNILSFINIIAIYMEKYKYYIEIDDDMYDAGYLEVHRDSNFARIEIYKILEDKNLFLTKSVKNIIKNIEKLEWNDIKDKYKYDIGSAGKISSGTEYIYTANKKNS